MSEQKITVKPDALHQMLSDLSRTASKSFDIPILNGVLLQVEETDSGKSFVGTSTNRFVLGQAQIAAEGAMEPMFLELDRVGQLIRILKPYAKSGDMSCQVERVADTVTLYLAGDLILPALSVTIPVADLRTDFPKVAHLLPTADSAKPGGQVAFNPRYLSVFCAIAKERGENMKIFPNAPEKPQLIQIGEDYRALIMPLRNEKTTDVTWVLPASGREASKETAAASAA